MTKLATMVSGGLGNCSTYALASRRLACSRAYTGLRVRVRVKSQGEG